MNIRALRLTPKGELSRVELEAASSGNHLQSMYRELDCDVVECVGLADDLDLWVDEEGKLKGEREVNLGATALLRRHGVRDLVAGNALLTGGADVEGNTLGISDETAADVERFLRGGR